MNVEGGSGQPHRLLLSRSHSSGSDSPVDHRNVAGQFPTQHPAAMADIAEEKLEASQLNTTMSSGGMASLDEVFRRAARPDKPIEVDFYKNPTVLSRLCLNQKYDSAMKRLAKQPDEAAIWVCSKRSKQTGRYYQTTPSGRRTATANSAIYSVRQLPLHICCTNLRRTHDPKLKILLNQLITNLIVTNADGCSQCDHQGQRPLELAIWHGAYPETISVFLTARPELLALRDHQGRTMVELNQHRSGANKKAVADILALGVAFWQEAHDDNADRFHKAAKLLAAKRSKMSGTTETAKKLQSDDEIEAISWEMLEERALALEQILCEMNEQNFELNQRIELLLAAKEDLAAQLDQLHSRDIHAELAKVQQENVQLSEQLVQLEEVLRETRQVQSAAAPNDDESRMAADIASDTGRALLEENRDLRRNLDALSSSYRDQRASIHNLETMVRRLLPGSHSNSRSHKHKSATRHRGSGGGGGGGAAERKQSSPHSGSPQSKCPRDGSSGTGDTLSTSSSLRDAEDLRDHHGVASNPQELPLNRTPSRQSWVPPNFTELKKMDDLQAIFRSAAESQAIHRSSISPSLVDSSVDVSDYDSQVEDVVEERKESEKSFHGQSTDDSDGLGLVERVSHSPPQSGEDDDRRVDDV